MLTMRKNSMRLQPLNRIKTFFHVVKHQPPIFVCLQFFLRLMTIVNASKGNFITVEAPSERVLQVLWNPSILRKAQQNL